MLYVVSVFLYLDQSFMNRSPQSVKFGEMWELRGLRQMLKPCLFLNMFVSFRYV